MTRQKKCTLHTCCFLSLYPRTYDCIIIAFLSLRLSSWRGKTCSRRQICLLHFTNSFSTQTSCHKSTRATRRINVLEGLMCHFPIPVFLNPVLSAPKTLAQVFGVLHWLGADGEQNCEFPSGPRELG